MKILFLTPWYPDNKVPNHGVFVREQAVAVGEHNKVIVVSSKTDYSIFSFFSWTVKETTFENVKEFRLVINRSIPIINQLIYFIISVRFAYRIAKEFNPDIIHGNIGYPGGFWAYLVSKLVASPFIITEHYSRFTYNFRSPIHKALTLFSLKRAKRLLTVSKHSCREIGRYINRSIDVVPNLVDVGRFAVIRPQSLITQIGFLGGLNSDNHQKGLDLLLRALSTIEHDFVLHIGGDGKMRPIYEALAQKLGIHDKCRFYGLIDYSSVPRFMRQLHFFVSVSRFESFGIAMLEAMASGLPVLATDSGGPSDFVNKQNGLLIKKENMPSLIGGIQTMINSYNEFDREKIRAFVIKNYSKEHFKKVISSVYTEVIDNS
jgi:L-malate glycosyltransferase